MNQSLGTLYIISAPSGGGKTSLVNALVSSINNLFISISYTTRPLRPGEQNGVNYHFITTDQFHELIKQNTFIEHAKVFDHHYGTSREWVNQQLQQGHDVILEIDWQGAQQIRQNFKHCVSIFILPPSRDALRERLMNRAQDDSTVIDQRMMQARNEMSHYHEFDYLIINDIFENALTDLKAVIRSRRLLTSLQSLQHEDLIKNLLQDVN